MDASEDIKVNNQAIDEIDLEKIDWNKLKPEEWASLERRMQEKHQLHKKLHRPPTLIHKKQMVPIKIRGQYYEIKEVTFNRLKLMKSNKSREKLIEEIITTHKPIENTL